MDVHIAAASELQSDELPQVQESQKPDGATTINMVSYKYPSFTKLLRVLTYESMCRRSELESLTWKTSSI